MLDEAAAGATFVITKRGRPVARVVPLEDHGEIERTILAELRGLAATGRVRLLEADLLVPSSTLERWSALEDWHVDSVNADHLRATHKRRPTKATK